MQLALVVVSVLGMAMPPRSLWGLTSQAELVVIARVADVEKNGVFHDARATLAVTSVLKGAASETITVNFSSTMVCPPPPKFPVGRFVLAFLQRDPSGDGYESIGWEASKPLSSESEMKQLRAMAALAAHAQRVGTPEARRHWALQAFKLKATRRDGLEELGPALPSGFSRFDASSARTLSTDEFAFIEDAFINDPSFDETLQQTLALFNGRDSAALTATAIKGIETILSTTERPYWLDDAISLIEARLQKHAYDPSLHVFDRRTNEQRIRDVEARWAELTRRFKLRPTP